LEGDKEGNTIIGVIKKQFIFLKKVIYANQLLLVSEYLKINGNKDTSLKAMYLLNSVTTSQFIICLKIIAKYSAIIEPVTNILQGVDCDVLNDNEHIKKLIKHINNDRFKSDDIFLS